MLCRCECGTEKEVRADHLSNGCVVSCGCHKAEEARRRMTIHGDGSVIDRVAEYTTWKGMIQRCSDPHSASYYNYGARGISVCERWADYSLFLEDMGRKPSPGHSIERNDVNGNYEPGNCRWATKVEQARNTRASRILTIDGTSRTMAEWAEACGTNVARIWARLNLGWSHADAVMRPKGFQLKWMGK